MPVAMAGLSVQVNSFGSPHGLEAQASRSTTGHSLKDAPHTHWFRIWPVPLQSDVDWQVTICEHDITPLVEAQPIEVQRCGMSFCASHL